MKIQRKIIFLGSDGVGKTSIIHRYTRGTFSNSYLVTLGVDFYESIFYRDDTEKDALSAQIWDLASQATFARIRAQYISYTHYVIIVVDINRTDDIYIQPWIDDLKAHAGKDVPYVLALNKIDLATEKNIEEDVKALQKRYSVPIFPTSAKTGENINELFNYIADQMWKEI